MNKYHDIGKRNSTFWKCGITTLLFCVILSPILYGQSTQRGRPGTRPFEPPVTTAPAPAEPPAPASPVVAAPEQPLAPEIQEGLTLAVGAFQQSDFPRTLEILNELYKRHPNIAPPRILLAQWFAQSNLGEAVRGSLELATEETPEDPEAYLLLGEILLRQQYLTAAEQMLKVASVKLNAYTANAPRKKQMQSSLLRNRISLAEARSRWTEMNSVIDSAIALDGKTPTLVRQKAIALFQSNRETEALGLFHEAETLSSDDPEESTIPAEASMSRLYQLRGDTENAKKFLAEALAKYPKSKEVIVLSIQARINEDQVEEARKLADQLLDEDPEWEAAKKLRATIALYLNEYSEAEKYFQELIIASPSDAQAANGLALALCEQEDVRKLQRALEYARENVRKNEQNSDYWATLGWVLYKARQMEAAAQALKQAAATGRVNAATAYYLARLALQSGRSTEARQLLEAAVDSPTPFAKRRDSVRLLEELKK